MPFLITLVVLILFNTWVTVLVRRSGDGMDHKGLHVAMVWIAPFIGGFMTWMHVATVERQQTSRAQAPSSRERPLPHVVAVPGAAALQLGPVMQTVNGFPLLDWPAVQAWLADMSDDGLRSQARLQAQRAWLDHLSDALGICFHVVETEHAFVVSSLEPAVVAATARYVTKTRWTIAKVLGRLAQFGPAQKSILLVLDDEEWYYHYVSVYYPSDGEFAISGGMFIDAGCPHFVVVRADLATIEPVIAHELTHSAVTRLRLPLWLDEGIAVNTEHKVAGAGRGLYTPQEIRAKHLAFWTEAEIQQFWSGESFRRTDDGNLLSYDLARIMVEQMAGTWERFEQFVLNASRTDAGASAAAEHLQLDLGAFVCALFDKTVSPAWSPAPQDATPG